MQHRNLHRISQPIARSQHPSQSDRAGLPSKHDRENMDDDYVRLLGIPKCAHTQPSQLLSRPPRLAKKVCLPNRDGKSPRHENQNHMDDSAGSDHVRGFGSKYSAIGNCEKRTPAFAATFAQPCLLHRAHEMPLRSCNIDNKKSEHGVRQAIANAIDIQRQWCDKFRRGVHNHRVRVIYRGQLLRDIRYNSIE